MPRFLIDACLPRGVSAGGTDCVDVVDCLGDGATDADVIALAIQQGRIVVTADIGDFSALASSGGHPGTVLVDQADTPSETIALARAGIDEAARLLAEGKALTGRLIRVRRNGRIVVR